MKGSPGPVGFGSMDGVLQPLDALVVPVTDRGLLLGDAVFETLRTYDGRLFALEEHLDRLERSLRAIGMTQLPSREKLARWAREVVAATLQQAKEHGGGASSGVPACVLRITVTRGSGPHGISPKGAGPARVIVTGRVLPATPRSVYENGLRVITSSVKRAPVAVQDPTIKATSALNLILARMEADEAGVDEALLTDAQGRYLEASAANLFALKDHAFYTPQGPHGVLEGVTAGILEDLLQEEGFTPQWGPIPGEVLFGADEVLLTQTTREVLPVVRLDDRVIGSGKPGPWAKRLRERFLARLEEDLDQGHPDR